MPYRANIFALKRLGVRWIISVSACGSMREEIAPLDVVIPDQLFDRTRTRPSTFFDQEGAVAHIGFADPFCPVLGDVLQGAGAQAGARVHRGGTYICIEGPQFSTRAKSRIYRQWGVDVIGMTAIPEAKLAREAEIHYATLAFVTDYDVWHEIGGGGLGRAGAAQSPRQRGDGAPDHPRRPAGDPGGGGGEDAGGRATLSLPHRPGQRHHHRA